MSSTTKAAWYWDIIRSLLVSLDNVGFSLLSTVYKIFYTVATATIISGDLIRNFYGRIQLILGIIMIFKLTMSILNIIINPDSIKDSKNGPGKIIPRVVVSVFLLLLVIPINIPIKKGESSRSLNSYINDHGILFGFLYKFQDSMMRENIIGKLVLGINTDMNVPPDQDPDFNDIDANDLSAIGDTIAAQVARMVIRPNVVDESEPYCLTEDAGDFDPENPCPNTRCPVEVVANNYTDESLSASSIADLVNVSCRNNELNKTIYAFSYTPLLGLIVSAVMSFIIIGFTIDVAVRALKLAILRLIAPIPIISYIDPKSEKDGAFGNWLKALISTYIDLFIRLAIIFFGAFIIQSLFSEGTFDSIKSGNALVDIFSKIAIILGLLVFMKQAPTFLKNALGIKGQPMGNAGLSGLLGGAAMAIGGGGLAGFGLGMMQGMNTSADAQAQGKAFSPFNSWSQNRDQMAKIRTGDRDARGGLVGRTMDRLNFATRERSARSLGIGKEDVARLNYRKKMAQARAGETATALKAAELQANSVGAQDFGINLSPYLDANGNLDTARAYAAYGQDRVDKQFAYKKYMDAYNEDTAAQIALQKASKAADNADKYAGQLGTAPDVRGFYRKTYRSNRQVRLDKNKNPLDRFGNIATKESDYTYEPDLNGSGVVDDSIMSTMGHGSTGPGPGPGPGPRP